MAQSDVAPSSRLEDVEFDGGGASLTIDGRRLRLTAAEHPDAYAALRTFHERASADVAPARGVAREPQEGSPPPPKAPLPAAIAGKGTVTRTGSGPWRTIAQWLTRMRRWLAGIWKGEAAPSPSPAAPPAPTSTSPLNIPPTLAPVPAAPVPAAAPKPPAGKPAVKRAAAAPVAQALDAAASVEPGAGGGEDAASSSAATPSPPAGDESTPGTSGAAKRETAKTPAKRAAVARAAPAPDTVVGDEPGVGGGEDAALPSAGPTGPAVESAAPKAKRPARSSKSQLPSASETAEPTPLASVSNTATPEEARRSAGPASAPAAGPNPASFRRPESQPGSASLPGPASLPSPAFLPSPASLHRPDSLLRPESLPHAESRPSPASRSSPQSNSRPESASPAKGPRLRAVYADSAGVHVLWIVTGDNQPAAEKEMLYARDSEIGALLGNCYTRLAEMGCPIATFPEGAARTRLQVPFPDTATSQPRPSDPANTQALFPEPDKSQAPARVPASSLSPDGALIMRLHPPGHDHPGRAVVSPPDDPRNLRVLVAPERLVRALHAASDPRKPADERLRYLRCVPSPVGGLRIADVGLGDHPDGSPEPARWEPLPSWWAALQPATAIAPTPAALAHAVAANAKPLQPELF